MAKKVVKKTAPKKANPFAAMFGKKMPMMGKKTDKKATKKKK